RNNDGTPLRLSPAHAGADRNTVWLVNGAPIKQSPAHAGADRNATSGLTGRGGLVARPRGRGSKPDGNHPNVFTQLSPAHAGADRNLDPSIRLRHHDRSPAHA